MAGIVIQVRPDSPAGSPEPAHPTAPAASATDATAAAADSAGRRGPRAPSRPAVRIAAPRISGSRLAIGPE
ncbi:hypothetical protein BF93_14435 [Brachybacterium phenoliresistens]|uniref:Uncharacterized protein n=1 Tax=Brachybacterium phenoliresistens TaxID=396014 RepID=Z9JWA3_9MICO|nr:hypothetical protein BF93_14435 [Brachybacterium phenoliresistens]